MKKIYIISDVHLGSISCLSEKLINFLHDIYNKNNELIINGDLFDSLNFNKLNKFHLYILNLLKSMSTEMKITYITGNHDVSSYIMKSITGIEFVDEYVFKNKNKKILIIHGDKFDDFIKNHPIISKIASLIHWGLQKINKNISNSVKLKSKLYIDSIKKVKLKALEYCEMNNCDIICCGHTHYPELQYIEKNNKIYCNSGSWTEKNGSYLVIEDGNINLYHDIN